MRYILLMFFLVPFQLLAQTNPVLEVESYQLENGLTVYLNEDPTASRVFGAVAINAGSKNDPADATGIAHYLEHLLFKGTTSMGTWNYEDEKIHLDSITYWYTELGKTVDETKRQIIQREINRHSIEASKYSLPNDFDNLLKSIGSTGVNAFTSNDMTFYHNSFPANQVEKWLDIFSHRFEDPVFRSFQSELEVVYEEKNRAIDGFEFQIFEKFMDELFSPHPYGTQTTLGKTEHLKNPNLDKMYEFFKTYYVANNMALVLSGNFDKEKTKPFIDATFGKWERGASPPELNFSIKKIEGKQKGKVRFTPVKVSVYGFKTKGANHPDQPTLDVISGMFTNGSETGLLDQLNQKNKLTYTEMFAEPLNDDGAAVFIIVPKIIIQSFGKAEKLIFKEINRVKTGDFEDQLLSSVKNELYVDFQRSLENVTSRGIAIGESFNRGITWNNYLSYTSAIEKVTKEDVMRVAQKYYGDDFMAVYSRMGFPKKQKLEKPGFKPVKPDSSKESEFAKSFNEKKGGEISPTFIDFKEDAGYSDLKNNNRLYVVKNPINDIFSLDIRYHYGNDNNRDIRLASMLMAYAGTKDKSMLEVKQAFARLGTDYSVSSSRNYLNIHLEGKEENLAASLALLNDVVQEPALDKKAQKLVTKQARTAKRIDKRTPSVVGRAMRLYAVYGDGSYYLKRHTIKEIKSADLAVMLQKFKEATNYAASIHFVGNTSEDELKKLFKETYQLSQSGKREQITYFKPAKYSKPIIYFVHNKKAVQSQIYFYREGKPFKQEDYPYYNGFNAYFGDGFSGLVLQEIREYRSLAYSAWGRYFPNMKSGERGYINAYVGCQGDKTNESVDVMMSLLDTMPNKPERMDGIRSGLQQKVLTSYPSFRTLSRTIENYKMLGYQKSPEELAYPVYEGMEFDEIMDFYKEHAEGKPVVITIYGDKKRINIDQLKKYGEVRMLKRGDVMVF